jgi:hypothetical protein
VSLPPRVPVDPVDRAGVPLQFTVSAIVAAALVLASGWWHAGRRPVAMAQVARMAGVAFALGTLVALAIAHTKGGLFGFRETGLQPAPQTAITIIVEWEAAVFLVLAMVCGHVAASRSRANDQDRRTRLPNAA